MFTIRSERTESLIYEKKANLKGVVYKPSLGFASSHFLTGICEIKLIIGAIGQLTGFEVVL